jgi:hypothetical protein
MPKQQFCFITRGLRGSSEPPRRLAVLFFVSVLVLQLSLSVFLHPINQILCLEESRSSAAPVGPDHSHSHDHDGTALHSEHQPEGNTLNHCKDSLFGITVTSLQPFTLPVSPALQVMLSAWIDSSLESTPHVERDLPPPFQPPRA